MIFRFCLHDIGRDNERFGRAFVRFARTSALMVILLASVGFAVSVIAVVVISAVIFISDKRSYGKRMSTG